MEPFESKHGWNVPPRMVNKTKLKQFEQDVLGAKMTFILLATVTFIFIIQKRFFFL